MLYAILCYHSEDVVGAWSREARIAFNQAIALGNTAPEAAHIRRHLDRLIADAAPLVDQRS
jgi:hypothetical protein